MIENRAPFNPTKYIIKDIVGKQPPLDVWLQGTIEQNVGNEIIIVSDGSGKVKVVKCQLADGIVDKTSLRKGTYCCILGVATKTNGLPEVEAKKIVDLTLQAQMKVAWESEVREAKLVLQGKLIPEI